MVFIVYSRLNPSGCSPYHSSGCREYPYRLIAFILMLLGFALSSCCHNKASKDTAGDLGISPELHEKYMRESPLYRSFVEGPDYKTSTQQFLERIKAKHRPKELQDWAQKLLNLHESDKESVTVPYNEVPSFILKLDPPLEPLVVVFPKSHVMVDWGGGFGHWGLFLATTKAPHNPSLYAIEWVPGIYVYHSNK